MRPTNKRDQFLMILPAITCDQKRIAVGVGPLTHIVRKTFSGRPLVHTRPPVRLTR